MAGILTPEAHSVLTSAAEPGSAIRTATAEDLRQAWLLQREAFTLPEAGPPPHPGLSDELRVLTEADQVRSCLTLVHADLWIRGARLPMGGIRHVATHPEAQNQGHASALLRDTLRLLRERSVPTSVLFPFSFRYYRKFGYELGGNHVQFWCRPNCIPAYGERRMCRVATAADAPELARFHAASAGASACALYRDERRWLELMGGEERQVVRCGEDSLLGYAITSESRDAYGGRILRVLDLEAGSPAAWRALLGWFAHSPAESVEWLARASDLHASGLMRTPAPLREGFKPRGIATVRPLFQFRVVHLEEALRRRLPFFERGEFRLALRIHDEALPENSRPLALLGTADGLELRSARATDPCLEADIRVFSQLFCGYMSPSEAVSQELARCSSPEALELAERLFPTGDPFLSELDRF